MFHVNLPGCNPILGMGFETVNPTLSGRGLDSLRCESWNSLGCVIFFDFASLESFLGTFEIYEITMKRMRSAVTISCADVC